MENIIIKEDIESSKSTIHVLPCKISHNGEANVETYFYHTKSGDLLETSFRGRPLNGVEIELLDGKLGLVIDKQDNELEATSSFNKIYSWHLDDNKITILTDQLSNAIKDWYEISNITMAGSELVLRVRTKKGILRIQKNLTSNSTLGDLKKLISELNGIAIGSIKLLKGYPPTTIENMDSKTLASLDITNGDMLTLEEIAQKDVKTSNETIKNVSPKKQSDTSGILMRKVVPANNSCLFTSVYFVVENGTYDLNIQKSMREYIAKTVQSDPITFNEGILGYTNKKYCEWIRNPDTWGGSIEIMILSKYYKIEICVVDIKTGRIDRFGEDCNYPSRVFIIYDGIHFDPLYLEPHSKNDKIQTRFSTHDDQVMQQALEMAETARKNRQFTDVQKFSLRCLVCQKGLTGQHEAQEHAESTGHINFGEV